MIVNIKVFITLCLLFSSFVLYGQQPPPSFKLIFDKTEASTGKLTDKFQFITFIHREGKQEVEVEISEWDTNELVSDKGNNLVYVIIAEGMNLPFKGDVVQLSLKDKASLQLMTIFIRLSYRLGYSEKIIIPDFTFQEGTYFMDMCKSKNKYEIMPGKEDQSVIDTRKLKKHSISVDKLNRVLKRYSCLKVGE